ncbi:MAG: LysR substrate-binding domain-containing protein [Cyclobacteriaceae bacterium]
MTITQLEYVLAVDEYRNFALAASKCNVTQPTLSMQLKKLEEELDVVIFDRSKKPVVPTDVGIQLIEHARSSLMGLNQIKDIVQENNTEIMGDLRIGIIPTLSPYLLPLFILNFTKKYPSVNVSIKELLSEQIIDDLKNDHLDVAILATPIADKQIKETPLFYEAFVVYMSTSHPLNHQNQVNFSDLDLKEMWLLKEGHCFRNQAVNICADSESKGLRHINFQSGSLETLRNIVDQEFGYTLLPELAIFNLEEAKHSRIKHFKEPRPVREIGLITHRTNLKRKLINALKTEILETIPKNMLNKERGRLVEWR